MVLRPPPPIWVFTLENFPGQDLTPFWNVDVQVRQWETMACWKQWSPYINHLQRLTAFCPEIWPYTYLNCVEERWLWLRASVSESKTRKHREILTRLLTSAEGCKCSKKHVQRRKTPIFIPNTGGISVPFHWSGQGAHSSLLANLKQIVTGRRGKEEGGGECLQWNGNEVE